MCGCRTLPCAGSSAKPYLSGPSPLLLSQSSGRPPLFAISHPRPAPTSPVAGAECRKRLLRALHTGISHRARRAMYANAHTDYGKIKLFAKFIAVDFVISGQMSVAVQRNMRLCYQLHRISRCWMAECTSQPVQCIIHRGHVTSSSAGSPSSAPAPDCVPFPERLTGAVPSDLAA